MTSTWDPLRVACMSDRALLEKIRPRLGIRSAIARWRHRRRPPVDRTAFHDYWRSPPEEVNAPETYLSGSEASPFLYELVARYVEPAAPILEIGCNVGRNLAYLHARGYPNLTGIEINSEALTVMRREHPALATDATLINEPVEEVVSTFKDQQFELVFTVAVLEHLHSDSEWVFGEIGRSARCVITIEDEKSVHWRVIPRNYRRALESSTDLVQVEERACADVVGLGPAFTARVFQRDPA